ncbi:hypothetical protein ADUPG1_008363 [Aduncisulcus paluster]|uniref:Uncharacterized protein n=1 Tax=Aduncisulcus paluster TaxID=2918883 RepID=A0ABQ5KU52_9EUKA|nr:hypothetical protein ADUPG1_008363 [Aduncisulcus paluster]
MLYTGSCLVCVSDLGIFAEIPLFSLIPAPTMLSISSTRSFFHVDRLPLPVTCAHPCPSIEGILFGHTDGSVSIICIEDGRLSSHQSCCIMVDLGKDRTNPTGVKGSREASKHMIQHSERTHKSKKSRRAVVRDDPKHLPTGNGDISLAMDISSSSSSSHIASPLSLLSNDSSPVPPQHPPTSPSSSEDTQMVPTDVTVGPGYARAIICIKQSLLHPSFFFLSSFSTVYVLCIEEESATMGRGKDSSKKRNIKYDLCLVARLLKNERPITSLSSHLKYPISHHNGSSRSDTTGRAGQDGIMKPKPRNKDECLLLECNGAMYNICSVWARVHRIQLENKKFPTTGTYSDLIFFSKHVLKIDAIKNRINLTDSCLQTAPTVTDEEIMQFLALMRKECPWTCTAPTVTDEEIMQFLALMRKECPWTVKCECQTSRSKEMELRQLERNNTNFLLYKTSLQGSQLSSFVSSPLLPSITNIGTVAKVLFNSKWHVVVFESGICCVSTVSEVQDQKKMVASHVQHAKLSVFSLYSHAISARSTRNPLLMTILGSVMIVINEATILCFFLDSGQLLSIKTLPFSPTSVFSCESFACAWDSKHCVIISGVSLDVCMYFTPQGMNGLKEEKRIEIVSTDIKSDSKASKSRTKNTKNEKKVISYKVYWDSGSEHFSSRNISKGLDSHYIEYMAHCDQDILAMHQTPVDKQTMGDSVPRSEILYDLEFDDISMAEEEDHVYLLILTRGLNEKKVISYKVYWDSGSEHFSSRNISKGLDSHYIEYMAHCDQDILAMHQTPVDKQTMGDSVPRSEILYDLEFDDISMAEEEDHVYLLILTRGLVSIFHFYKHTYSRVNEEEIMKLFKSTRKVEEIAHDLDGESPDGREKEDSVDEKKDDPLLNTDEFKVHREFIEEIDPFSPMRLNLLTSFTLSSIQTVHIISYASPKALYTFVITHGLPIQCYTTMYEEEEEEEEEIVGEMLAEQDASSSARIASRIYSSLVTSPNLTTSLSSLISIQADAFKHNDSDKKDCYTTMYEEEEEEEEEEIVGEMLAEQDASSSARIASRIYSSLVTSPNLTTSLSSLISIQADAFKHNDSDKKDVESEGNEAKTKQAIQDITDIKYDPLLGCFVFYTKTGTYSESVGSIDGPLSPRKVCEGICSVLSNRCCVSFLNGSINLYCLNPEHAITIDHSPRTVITPTSAVRNKYIYFGDYSFRFESRHSLNILSSLTSSKFSRQNAIPCSFTGATLLWSRTIPSSFDITLHSHSQSQSQSHSQEIHSPLSAMGKDKPLRESTSPSSSHHHTSELHRGFVLNTLLQDQLQQREDKHKDMEENHAIQGEQQSRLAAIEKQLREIKAGSSQVREIQPNSQTSIVAATSPQTSNITAPSEFQGHNEIIQRLESKFEKEMFEMKLLMQQQQIILLQQHQISQQQQSNVLDPIPSADKLHSHQKKPVESGDILSDDHLDEHEKILSLKDVEEAAKAVEREIMLKKIRSGSYHTSEHGIVDESSFTLTSDEVMSSTEIVRRTGVIRTNSIKYGVPKESAQPRVFTKQSIIPSMKGRSVSFGESKILPADHSPHTYHFTVSDQVSEDGYSSDTSAIDGLNDQESQRVKAKDSPTSVSSQSQNYNFSVIQPHRDQSILSHRRQTTLQRIEQLDSSLIFESQQQLQRMEALRSEKNRHLVSKHGDVIFKVRSEPEKKVHPSQGSDPMQSSPLDLVGDKQISFPPLAFSNHVTMQPMPFSLEAKTRSAVELEERRKWQQEMLRKEQIAKETVPSSLDMVDIEEKEKDLVKWQKYEERKRKIQQKKEKKRSDKRIERRVQEYTRHLVLQNEGEEGLKRYDEEKKEEKRRIRIKKRIKKRHRAQKLLASTDSISDLSSSISSSLSESEYDSVNSSISSDVSMTESRSKRLHKKKRDSIQENQRKTIVHPQNMQIPHPPDIIPQDSTVPMTYSGSTSMKAALGQTLIDLLSESLVGRHMRFPHERDPERDLEEYETIDLRRRERQREYLRAKQKKDEDVISRKPKETIPERFVSNERAQEHPSEVIDDRKEEREKAEVDQPKSKEIHEKQEESNSFESEFSFSSSTSVHSKSTAREKEEKQDFSPSFSTSTKVTSSSEIQEKEVKLSSQSATHEEEEEQSGEEFDFSFSEESKEGAASPEAQPVKGSKISTSTDIKSSLSSLGEDKIAQQEEEEVSHESSFLTSAEASSRGSQGSGNIKGKEDKDSDRKKHEEGKDIGAKKEKTEEEEKEEEEEGGAERDLHRMSNVLTPGTPGTPATPGTPGTTLSIPSPSSISVLGVKVRKDDPFAQIIRDEEARVKKEKQENIVREQKRIADEEARVQKEKDEKEREERKRKEILDKYNIETDDSSTFADIDRELASSSPSHGFNNEYIGPIPDHSTRLDDRLSRRGGLGFLSEASAGVGPGEDEGDGSSHRSRQDIDDIRMSGEHHDEYYSTDYGAIGDAKLRHEPDTSPGLELIRKNVEKELSQRIRNRNSHTVLFQDGEESERMVGGSFDELSYGVEEEEEEDGDTYMREGRRSLNRSLSSNISIIPQVDEIQPHREFGEDPFRRKESVLPHEKQGFSYRHTGLRISGDEQLSPPRQAQLKHFDSSQSKASSGSAFGRASRLLAHVGSGEIDEKLQDTSSFAIDKDDGLGEFGGDFDIDIWE